MGPTVWWDGRVIGGWASRPVKGAGEGGMGRRVGGGEIAIRFLEDAGADAVAAVEAAAEQLAARLGPVRVTARGRGPSPVEQELIR